jgi:GNAT superfamily N-acetyltransferase
MRTAPKRQGSSLEWGVEEACLNAWPALREVVLGGWLVRFSEGLTRRANSANPLLPVTCADPRECEALYRRLGQPAIFRLVSLLDPSLDEQLEGLGYTREGESCVLYGDLAGVDATADPEVRLLTQPSPEWFAAMAALQGHTGEQARTYQRIVGQLAMPAAFALLSAEGETVALGYGALHRGMLCYESIITGGRRRRQGYGRRIVTALAAWAIDNGATAACLEVEAGNLPARALYDAIGLKREIYRYHYRREPHRDVVTKL